jgi:phage shock protein C
MDRLYRSSTQRMLGGVCGGLGEYFAIDPTLVRIVYILVTVATGLLPGAGLYVVLWLIVPSESSAGKSVRQSLRDNVDDMAQSARNIGDEVQASFRRNSMQDIRRVDPAILAGLLLVAIGVLFLLANFDLLAWLHWARFWPLIIIIIGLVLLLRRQPRQD